MTGLLFALVTSCSLSGSGTLFDGKDGDKWKTSGNVIIKEGVMTLTGNEAQAILKNGKYKNFDLSMELRTTPC